MRNSYYVLFAKGRIVWRQNSITPKHHEFINPHKMSTPLDTYGRVELTKIQATQRNCMKLLPLGKKSLQKIVVGDESGVVHSFGIKKGYITNNFKTLPKDKRITGININKDKIFYSSSRMVRGLTKKGKEFYNIETGVPDDILNIEAKAPELWVASEYVMYSYNDSVESQFYMCPDRINTLTTHQISSPSERDVVLGCQDRILRVVNNSNVILEIVVEGAATALAQYPRTTQQSKPNSIVYGTENGALGCLQMTAESVKKLWELPGKHSVQVITPSLISGIGVDDIMVGRDNGLVQVLAFDSSPVPRVIFERNVEESITGIESGFLTSTNVMDMIVSTYSGKILTYSPESSIRVDPQSSIIDIDNIYGGGASLIPESAAKLASKLSKKIQNPLNQTKVIGMSHQEKVQALHKDISKVEQKLMEAKTKYNKMSEDMVAVHCKYNMKTKFILDSASACYRLTIELDISIDSIALHGDVSIDIVDLETSNFVSSITPLDEAEQEKSGAKFLATFRATESLKRFELLLRTVEGQYGRLEAYVTPKLTPKIAKVETFQIRPLFLHERLHEIENDDRLMNTLNISGNFSLGELHSWIIASLEGVPEKITKDEVEYYFRSTFQNTILVVKCKKGEALFKSDNVSTISILDEVISKEATERKKRVNTTFKIEDETFSKIIEMIYPKVAYQLDLSEKVKLIEPLKEIKMQEEDVSFLSKEYRFILDNEKRLLEEFSQQTSRLTFLFEIILKLFADKYKFKRQNPQPKLDQLRRMLFSKNFDQKTLIAHFKQ